MSRLPHPFGRSARANLVHGLFTAAALAFASVAVAQTPAGTQPVAGASLVVDSIAATHPALEVHRSMPKHAARPASRHFARYRHSQPIDVARPALAGVLLVEPIPPRIARPRPIVPMPAYFADGIASAFTTPPPPVVCERRPRDPALPDPRLYREVPLECGYDID